MPHARAEGSGLSNAARRRREVRAACFDLTGEPDAQPEPERPFHPLPAPVDAIRAEEGIVAAAYPLPCSHRRSGVTLDARPPPHALDPFPQAPASGGDPLAQVPEARH